MEYQKTIENLLSDLKGQRRMLNNELRRLPKGKLMISSNGKRLSFFNIGKPYNRKRPKGIGRKKDTVYKLARKAFIIEQIHRIDTNIAVLKKALAAGSALDTEALLDAMPKHFETLDPKRIIQPFGETDSQWPNPTRDSAVYPRKAALWLEGMTPQEWARLPYRENTKNLEHKIHKAGRGFYARSKSEVLVTGEYDSSGILYHYDEVIEIDGEYVSPDVIGLRSDGAFIYQEHLGLQDMNYTADMIRKLILYRKAGILLGKNLFLTFDDENGGINMDLIRASIEAMYFPGSYSGGSPSDGSFR